MSFSGKKYKRTKHENMEELLKITNTFGDALKYLQGKAPTFCFTKTGNNTFHYVLEAEGRHIAFDFTLGEEKELERRDGEKAIEIRDGKVVHFRREFNDNEARMIVTVDGWSGKQGRIFFEAIE